MAEEVRCRSRRKVRRRRYGYGIEEPRRRSGRQLRVKLRGLPERFTDRNGRLIRRAPPVVRIARRLRRPDQERRFDAGHLRVVAGRNSPDANAGSPQQRHSNREQDGAAHADILIDRRRAVKLQGPSSRDDEIQTSGRAKGTEVPVASDQGCVVIDAALCDQRVTESSLAALRQYESP